VRPAQCCCFSITGGGAREGAELVFGLFFGGKGWEVCVKWNVNWLPICYQKVDEECPLAQLPKKW